ncbi:hypothetical protein [Phaeobacter sp. 11ANDIMAR09]|uniref:hypothetical protein n=1 Tax=Phaeobacter sp. 11ANDIMAR09 TaxID=1225647 RepID=UPI0006C830E9|nr:hypothetical protein [Phaeobacter sp. 11ANDIMAR09]KPD14030.1 hypothetical protein AN476_02335 [Phaeobacter sp. 11ANDIMAR09]
MKLWVRLVSRSKSTRKGCAGNTEVCALIWREENPILGSIEALWPQKETRFARLVSHYCVFQSDLVVDWAKVSIGKAGEFDPFVQRVVAVGRQIVRFSALGKLSLFLTHELWF